jgi:class 3 adenylate cyclase
VKPPDRRKLIAVVYADMVGYSRLIGLDDAGTLARLKALRANLIDPVIEEHGGRIVQTGGDSLLIAFESIDGAMRCVRLLQGRVVHLAELARAKVAAWRSAAAMARSTKRRSDVTANIQPTRA